MSDSTRLSLTLNDSALWYEYYRVGTMYAFQLFHKQQFEQAFAEFNEFLTDPADIISLFQSLSANTWLTNSYNNLQAFVKQHRHFSEPTDFVGVKLENALQELQTYLTDLRGTFQTIRRRSPDAYLEVQSLVQNRLILRSVQDLLTIVETALLKIYLLFKNRTLASALLRNPDNCGLPTEVEKELKKHNLHTELVAFFQKQKRHDEALRIIKSTDSSTDDTIINYLSELDNDQLGLLLTYIRPMLITALQDKNDDLLHDILILFVGEPTPTSPSTIDTPGVRVIKFDPIEVNKFLKEINQDYAIRYLENICLKPELGNKQREIHNLLVYAYCDRIKQLSNEVKKMNKEKQRESKIEQQDTYQGNTFRTD